MFWGPMAVGGLLGIANAAWSSSQMDNTMKGVEESMKPYLDTLTDYKTTADDYMSIGSQVNKDLLSTNIQTGMDFGAAQSRQLARMLSSGGVGGMSGIMAANNANIHNQAYSNANDAWYNQFLKNQQMGAGMLGKHMAGMKDYSENLAQGHISLDSAKAQMISSGMGGMAKGFMDFGMAGSPGEFSFWG